MSNLLILFVFLLIGILMQKLKTFPNEIHVFLNSLILHLFLPALIFISIPSIDWNPNMLSLTFVGLPIIEAAYGKEALKFAVVLDQTGTFLVCSSFGVWLSRHFSQGKVSRTELLKAVLLFPPFVAFGLSLLLASCGWSPSGMSLNLLEKLSFLLAPVALISVGLQLKYREIRHDWHLLLWGLGFKLIMAPMLTSSILASSCGLHPRLAGLMVGVGVPVSFLTLSVWYQILN
jgi:predicted permease